jgi:hypothetical protein
MADRRWPRPRANTHRNVADNDRTERFSHLLQAGVLERNRSGGQTGIVIEVQQMR